MIFFRSVESRRRLLKHLPDLLIVVIVTVLGWRLFIVPHLRQQGAPAAPALSLATMAGPRFDLAGRHGRIVVLDFWASWCDPCKHSLPLVEAFAAAHPEIDVVPIDVGEPPAIAAAYAKSHGIRNVAFDPSEHAVSLFNVQGYPTLIGIDADGRIRDRWYGYIPTIGALLGDAETRYDAARRARKAATPATPS